MTLENGLGIKSNDNHVDMHVGQHEDYGLVCVPCATEISSAWVGEVFTTMHQST